MRFSYSFLVLLIISYSSCTNKQKDTKSKNPYLVVLGIAQDAGFPQAGCKKSCCTEVWKDNTKRKMVACLGLVDPQTNNFWMFDATPDFKDQLHNINTLLDNSEDVLPSGIFLTHAHVGHYTGLMELGREIIGTSKVDVFAMPRMDSFIRNNGPWSQLVTLNNIKLNLLKSDSTVSLTENISVTPLQVPHRDEFSETVGYIIVGNAKKALFIPDIDKWSKWDRSIVEVIKEVDVAYIDGSFYKNGEVVGRDMSEIPHPFIEESMGLFSNLKPEEKEKVRFIHLNHTNPLHNIKSDETKTILAKGFFIAKEGEKVEL
ncbi:MBL fold metallo-hydrolase [Chondrinema litorale]|uniref:MBL fold metallo-hydrolase n=1 Tax=Chondrinema litorale TaxID=2994555 RepID=UPI0025428BC2|nr:MBL fold metallo-hydrolase [Chondrinema litorale]UZR92894.1 MBL fold metallo-hydrolase [Chondrinema litorale]